MWSCGVCRVAPLFVLVESVSGRLSELEELLQARPGTGGGPPQGNVFVSASAAPPGLQMKSPEKKRRKSNTQVSAAWWGRRSCPRLASGAGRREGCSALALSPHFLTNGRGAPSGRGTADLVRQAGVVLSRVFPVLVPCL